MSNHLTAAPTWGQFQTTITEKLNTALLEARSLLPPNDPIGAEVMGLLNAYKDDLFYRLQRGGSEYGEDVLFRLGEAGAIVWVVSKAMRLLWSFEKGLSPDTRSDSWLDIAGYGILEAARQAYLASAGGPPSIFYTGGDTT